MTSQQDQIALRRRLEEILGDEHAATLMTMLPHRDDLVTKSDLAAVRDELKSEIAELRSELRAELGAMRLEMEHRFATKDDLFAVVGDFNEAMRGYVRTFIVVQAATVVGMSTILFGLLRFV